MLLGNAALYGCCNPVVGFIFAHNLTGLRLFEQEEFQRWGELPRVAVLDEVERDLIILGLRLGQ